MKMQFNFASPFVQHCCGFGFISARRKALCSWLGFGELEGSTIFILNLRKAQFIGYHLQGGGVWNRARPKKGF